MPIVNGVKSTAKSPIIYCLICPSPRTMYFTRSALLNRRGRGMQLIGANADFRAQTIFKAIGKSVEALTITELNHFSQKASCPRVIFGDNRFGMTGLYLLMCSIASSRR